MVEPLQSYPTSHEIQTDRSSYKLSSRRAQHINHLLFLYHSVSSTASKSQSERETLLDGYLWDIFWPLKDVKQQQQQQQQQQSCRCLVDCYLLALQWGTGVTKAWNDSKVPIYVVGTLVGFVLFLISFIIAEWQTGERALMPG